MPKFSYNNYWSIISIKEVNMTKPQKDEPFYLINQAAKLVGITSDRLRTYEEEGLIKPHRITHTKYGKRLFTQNEVEWLEIIRELIKLGVSIPAIRIFLTSNLMPNKKLLRQQDKQIFELVEKLYKHPVYETIFN